MTRHRRMNFGCGKDQPADALLRIFQREDVVIVLPMRPNPNVWDVLQTRLAGELVVNLNSPAAAEAQISCALSMLVVLPRRIKSPPFIGP
jgi:UDP-N-acetylglucosamine 2-epimerase